MTGKGRGPRERGHAAQSLIYLKEIRADVCGSKQVGEEIKTSGVSVRARLSVEQKSQNRE